MTIEMSYQLKRKIGKGDYKMKKINNKEVYAKVKKHILSFAESQDGQQAKFCEIRDNVNACCSSLGVAMVDYVKASLYVEAGGLLCYNSDIEMFLIETLAENAKDILKIKKLKADELFSRYQHTIGKTYERMFRAFNQNKL